MTSEFELYDLRVEVVGPRGPTDLLRRQAWRLLRTARRNAEAAAGSGVFDLFTRGFCCRCCRPSSGMSDPNDWMSTDAEVACPDPHCPTRFRITRTGRRRFRPLAQVTAIRMPGGT